ncbi:MAG: DUF4350 domain-containing protein [Syntrophaceae bacterium]
MAGSFRYGSYAFVSTLVFGAILVVLYLIVMHHPLSWDLSQDTHNRLDQKTLNILIDLKTPVDIKVFDKAGSDGAQRAKDLLQLYALKSTRITYAIIDPDTHPSQAKAYGVDRYGQAVLTSGEKREYVDGIDEQQLSTALIKLGQSRSKVIYCIEGHGEKRLDDTDKQGISMLKAALIKDNYTLKPLVLMREAIPADADCLVVIGPEKVFLPAEIEALEHYLDQGGRVMIALEPLKNAGLDGMLAHFGVTLADDIIIDPTSRVLGADYSMPVVMTYGDMPALAGFTLVTFFPTARALQIAQPLPKGIDVTWLAQTSEQSWSEFDSATWNREGRAQLDPADLKGPRIIALWAQKQVAPQKRAEMVVFGDSDFLSNTYLGLSGNEELALNCLNMLLGEKALITIEKGPSAFKPFMLTPRQGALVFWIPVAVMPALILAAGLWVFVSRRKA